MDQVSGEPSAAASPHRWQPLSSMDRRVLGVLAEKAKTTPDIYPMSLNAICTGCNQKSNRSPIVQYEPEEVEESLDRLRQLGAVTLVEGYGRVQKYRHHLYEWLGVDKVELAVMTELLLRGDQTIGELRGRAARMEPIADLAALTPVLDSLKSKGLVIGLTPAGRGHAVTHALYKPREIEELKARYAGGGPAGSPDEESPRHVSSPSSAELPSLGQRRVETHAAENELSTLRQQMAQFQRELDELRETQSHTADELQALKESLGG